jgi:hypothetical protein
MKADFIGRERNESHRQASPARTQSADDFEDSLVDHGDSLLSFEF